jgi:hypothetical protein
LDITPFLHRDLTNTQVDFVIDEAAHGIRSIVFKTYAGEVVLTLEGSDWIRLLGHSQIITNELAHRSIRENRRNLGFDE